MWRPWGLGGGGLGGGDGPKSKSSDQRACVLQTFRRVQPSRKMADLPTSFVFRHHFWCFPFLYIFIKNTKHNNEKKSFCYPVMVHFATVFLFFPCSFAFQLFVCLFFLHFFNSSGHLHIDKVYNILQLNKTEI